MAGLVLASWGYLFHLSRGMGATSVATGAMPQATPWSGVQFLLMWVMWAVMMVAMMVPSAAPVVLLFGAVQRGQTAASPAVPTWVFLGGYVAAWGVFSLGATAAQWGLHEARLLSPTMAATSPLLGGVLLLAAGVYQWTPAKAACLHHCRSPLTVLMHWLPGKAGAWRMGWGHGLFCLGCCWALMALLFVAGVMNLLWVALIALFVLVEKSLPWGRLVGRVAGTALAGAGVWVFLNA